MVSPTPINHLAKKAVQRRIVALIGLVATLGVCAVWLAYSDSDRRAVLQLPVEERQVLYQRTMETLQNTCRPGGTWAHRDYCLQQARFILNFPECDPECRGLSLEISSRPTK